MAKNITISCAVEGDIDEAVLKRIIEYVGATPGHIYGKAGKQALLKKLNGFNNAATISPWVVLVDLDQDDDCVANYRNECLPTISPKMCFRIVVHEIEAWLLADRERLASFLRVSLSLIPLNPDSEPDPKYRMIEIAKRSRRREIREDMVPRPGSRRKLGPGYNSRLIEFVSDIGNGWRLDKATERSESLKRCLACLQRLVEIS